MAYKGSFTVKNKAKYLGNPENVTYRSHWEKEVMMMLDDNDDVLEWGSEELVVPYENPVQGRRAKYYPDFIIKTKDGKIKVVEVKPYEQTIEPVNPGRKTRKYVGAVMTWAVNSEKWKAARALCEKNGLEFEIWTEETLKSMGLLKASRGNKSKMIAETKTPKMKPMVKRKPRPRPTRRS